MPVAAIVCNRFVAVVFVAAIAGVVVRLFTTAMAQYRNQVMPICWDEKLRCRFFSTASAQFMAK